MLELNKIELFIEYKLKEKKKKCDEQPSCCSITLKFMFRVNRKDLPKNGRRMDG